VGFCKFYDDKFISKTLNISLKNFKLLSAREWTCEIHQQKLIHTDKAYQVETSKGFA
jgi:hypothetical protein